MIDLDAVIRSSIDIEPLPVSVTRLASLVVKDDTNIDEIAEVISYDQSLTARVLRWANSAASANAAPVTSVDEAVMRMGTGIIMEVAIAAGVRKELNQSIPEYGLTEGELWKHSIASALAVDIFKGRTSVEVPHESFTTALLHDVGKLVLMRYLDPDTLRLLDLARKKGGASERKAESELLLVHHGEVGGLVAQHWKLPESIVRGIIYHHTPEEIDEPLPYVVQMANIVAKTIGTGSGMDTSDLDEKQSALDYLGFSEDEFVNICEKVGENLQEVIDRYR